MIDRGAAFGSAAISVALSMLVAFLFFYAFYLKGYRSGSKGAAAKICLLLGAVSAFFIFQGASIILNEVIHSWSVRISVREDKIYYGLLVSIPVAVVVSVLTWIVGFFDSSGNSASQSSESFSVAPKPTVDQQIFKSDLIFYALIAAAIILFAIVPNWSQIRGVTKDNPAAKIAPSTSSSNRSIDQSTPSKIVEQFIPSITPTSKAFEVLLCTSCVDGSCSESETLNELRISRDKILLFGKNAQGVSAILEFPNEGMKCTIVPEKNFSFYCSSSDTSSVGNTSTNFLRDLSFDGVSKLTQVVSALETTFGLTLQTTSRRSSFECLVKSM